MKNKLRFVGKTNWALKLFALILVSALSLQNMQAQYCTTGGATNTFDTQVLGVALNGQSSNINYTFSGCPTGNLGVLNLTATQIANVIPGSNYTVTVTWGSCSSHFGSYGTVWIDWDGNQIFSPTESIATYSSGAGPHTLGVYSFTVPLAANIGNTRMRIMLDESNPHPQNPCASFAYGSVMDFGITVDPGSACTGTPIGGTTTSSLTAACPGQNINLAVTGASIGSGLTYQWESSSNNTTWVNIPSATTASHTATQQATTYYRRSITCSGQTSFSASVMVNGLPNLPAGTYTVGTGGDYATIAAAVNAMNCGIAGPVVFNLLPASSPFAGGIEIPAIINSSATNTIVFNGNGSVVNQATQTYILALNGASYITFNNFKFINTVPTTNIFGIMIRGGSQYANITNNLIDVGFVSTSSLTAGIAVSGSTTSATTAGNNGQYINISNNEVVGGYYGINLYGAASYLNCFGNIVTNNTVRDFYLYGITLSNVDSTTVSNNDIHRMNRSTLTTFYGITFFTSRNIKVLRNRIHDASI
jgi:hypothetical protein